MTKKEIDIKINTIIKDSGGDNSIAGIRKSIKALKSEALSVGESGKGFKQLQNAANDLQDKLDDLGDSAKALKGTGIEKLNASIGLLTESFKNFDVDKAKIGLKGLGDAMGAIPIFLIIEGIRFLIDKFDDLQNSSGLIGEAFRAIGDIINDVIKIVTNFTDKIGLTNVAIEENAEKTIAASKKSQEAVTARYDAEIRVAQAAGENTVKLEREKQIAILKSLKTQIDAINLVAKANGRYSEEQIKQIEEIGKFALEAQTELDVIKAKEVKSAKDTAKEKSEIKSKAEKDSQAESKKLRDQELLEKIKFNTDIQEADEEQAEKEKEQLNKIEADKKEIKDAANAKALNDSALAYQEEDKLYRESLDNYRKTTNEDAIKKAKDALIGDEDNLQKQKDLLEAQKQEEIRIAEKTGGDINAINKKYAKLEEKLSEDSLKKKVAKLNQYVQAAASAFNSIINVFSEYQNLQRQNEEQDSKERQIKLDADLSALNDAKEQELAKVGLTEEQKAAINAKFAEQEYQLKLDEYNRSTDIKKRAFEQDKKLRIAQTIITTITGSVAALTSALASLEYPAGLILGLITATAVTAIGAAQVAAIQKQKFDAGTPPQPPKANIPSTNVGGLNQTNQPELKKIGRTDPNIDVMVNANSNVQKVYVTSSDVDNAINKDNVIKRRSSF